MALPVLPTSSNFLAVALVINRNRDGPRFVFHYPQHVVPTRSREREGSGGGEIDDEGDLFLERASRLPSHDTEDANRAAPSPAHMAQWNQDDHIFTESGSQVVPWEHVAGFPTKDLESILTPARAYDKKLFQISLDPLYCVSYPIYAPESGKWKKRRKVAVKEDVSASAHETDGRATEGPATGSGAPESEFYPEVKDATTQAAANTPAETVEEKPSSMTMFNLVFILNPRKDEVRELVNTMYVHIIKKTNKAYKYCQQRSDFVWKESKRILALKDKAREDQRSMSSLWDEIIATSSLAASMRDIYEAISQNNIATLQLDAAEAPVVHSVQIPMPFHTPDLPGDGESNLKGLWLTTANSFLDDDNLENPAFLDKNFALLLMEDEKKIIGELQNDPDETTQAMIEFVRHCKPALSFHQVSQQSSRVLTASQVRKFAQHFIFWRRAIAIPPLHARDMYVLSPNCDLDRLPDAALEWQRHFPLAPDLPKFLADLSAAPRPYKAFCPFKAHRPLYLAMLAWLMREGWVTQLCTFAYVVVWPEIIYEVDYALEADEIAREKRSHGGDRDRADSRERRAHRDRDHDDHGARAGDVYQQNSSPISPLTDRTRRRSSSARSVSEQTDTDHHASSPTSPTSHHPSSPPLRPTAASGHHGGPAPAPGEDDDNDEGEEEPTPAEQAAEAARLERLAARAERELAEKATAHARRAPPRPTRHPSVNHAPHLAHLSPYVILDAKKATGRESLFLSAIGRRLRGGAAMAAAPLESGGGGAAAAAGTGTGKGTGQASTAAGPAAGGGGDGGGGATGPAGKYKQATEQQAKEKAGRPGEKAEADGGGGDVSEWDEKVAKTWPVFCRYFNGRSALERIALQEDMKRKEAWNLLTAMSEYLLCVRHW